MEAHADHFVHDAPDTEWLRRCGEEGWVVLAKDKAIKKNPLERQALISHGIAAFFIIKTNATGEENAAALVEAMPKTIGILENQRRPFIARIYASGDVELGHSNTKQTERYVHPTDDGLLQATTVAERPESSRNVPRGLREVC